MPELSIDVTVANRFISSLSKSLQALCHGCMEFDSGIEIVGYINVNIDRGSKVDYVLNEKVLKSTTNSMTFVSNSFMAKKESQKHTRESACSPIPQHQAVASYPRNHGAHLGSQHHRASMHHPPHSQTHWGAQKRAWTDDWRAASKRHRVQNLPTETQHYSDQNIQNSHSSSVSHVFPESGFKQPHMPSSLNESDDTDSTQQLLMNIKKEALEGENPNADSEQLASDQTTEDQTHDSSQHSMTKVRIKTDPDASNSQSNKSNLTDDPDTESSENPDFKGTFLGPSTNKDKQNTLDEGNDDSEADTDLPSTCDQSAESASNKDLTLSEEASVAGTSSANPVESNAGVSADNEPGSDASVEYDHAPDDGSYSQSAYEDPGEGSSEAGQFEVIEIDDEDEDVHAMFGDPRSKFHTGKGLNQDSKFLVTPKSGNSLVASDRLFAKNSSFRGNSRDAEYSGVQCPHCPLVLQNVTDCRTHVSDDHGYPLQYTCSLCGKGYQTSMGLHYHMQAHEGKNYTCPLCGIKLTRTFSLKMHLKKVHNSGKCHFCNSLHTLGQEFDAHVLHCGTDFVKEHRHRIHSRTQELPASSCSASPVAIQIDQGQDGLTKSIGMIVGLQQSDAYGVQCDYCSKTLIDRFHLKAHMSLCHGHMMQFTCSLCGKGYQTYMGLHYHMQTHEGKKFVCTVCDRKFTRDFSLKVHIKNFHKSAKCPSCSGIFRLGQEYTEHVVHCPQ